jgi:MFS family permease
MVLEHANDTGRRGFFGGLTSASSSAGFLLATGVLALLTGVLSPEQFAAWGWRIPFLLSAVLLFVGLYIRTRVDESPVMKEVVSQEKTVAAPLLEVFRSYPRQVVVALLVPIGMFVAYYIMLVFAVPYATRVSDSPNSFMLTMLTIAQFIYIPAVVFFGWLSDRVGRRIPIIAGAGCLVVWGFAFFPLLLSGSTIGVFLAFTGSMIFMGAIYGPLATFLAELFGAGVRFSGMSFGYQVGSAIAGGLSPVVATALTGGTGPWLPVAVMISVACLITLCAVAFSKDTSRVDLRD